MESTLTSINKERLLDSLQTSSSIGATSNGGLNRLALSHSDKQMRDIFVDWLKQEGLEVRVDDFGNIYGRREGTSADAPPIVIGSHLDTQPCGGKYDGVLGVLIALETIRVLNDNNWKTKYPIEIVNFTNEEGARFAPPMLGSGGISGDLDKEFIYNRKDKDGVSFKQALQQSGYMGDESNRLSRLKYFIELHIEQGPILDKQEKSIGIVKGIQGDDWLTVKVIGENNHAGPTPMEDRKDALLAASKMIAKANEMAHEVNGLKLTVGKMNVTPNVPNVIPGEVEFTVDIRHEENETRLQAIERIKEQMSTIALMNKAEITITTDWQTDTVEFSSDIMEATADACEQWGYSSQSFFSGPGHDAKYLASIGESGMIFVPSKDGISHNEQEFTSDDDIVKGANAMLYVVKKLAELQL